MSDEPVLGAVQNAIQDANELPSTAPRKEKRWAWMAIVWLLVVVAVCVHNFYFWSNSGAHLDSDIMSLLPRDAHDKRIDEATRHLVDSGAREIVVLVGAESWEQARDAADAAEALLKDPATRLDANLRYRVDEAGMGEEALKWLAPYHAGLMTNQSADKLAQELARHDNDKIVQRALAQAHQTVGFRAVSWQEDPLGLLAEWLLNRGNSTRIRPRDGRLSVQGDGKYWGVINVSLKSSAFSLNGQEVLKQALDKARTAAQQKVATASLVAIGVPLYAEAAAKQGSTEMHTIGWGSLIGILILMWLSFRTFKPLGMVMLSLLLGCMTGITACALVFGKVHLMTLVFGAGIVGVAVDYGNLYYSTRQGDATSRSFDLARRLAPGLLLALLAAVMAYSALALAPFPGLRQMALFSGAGLAGAWLTVMCWFPWLDRTPKVRLTRFATFWAQSRALWPGLHQKPVAIGVGVLVLLCVGGCLQLTVQDDIRSLQNPSKALIDAQLQVSRILALPSPAQFILVSGKTPDEVLLHEEQVKPRLQSLVAAGDMTGWMALSDWVPSAGLQAKNAALLADARRLIWQTSADDLGLEAGAGNTPPPLQTKVLTIDEAMQGPFAAAMKHLWMGRLENELGDDKESEYASVIMISGLSFSSVAKLDQATSGLDGVRMVDKSGEISRLLGHYRWTMSWLAVLSCVIIWLMLWRRFGKRTWRAVAPTMLAAACALAVLGWLHMPLQLFHILAIFLVLGMGVDYGIFLLEHPAQTDGYTWLAVSLGAVSTLLSFGLLALSQTPFLRSFGIVMAIGIAVVWLMAPVFCAEKKRTVEI